MDKKLFLKNLSCPKRNVDVVLATDAYNEIDDRYALAYLIRNSDRLNLKAVYASPFFSTKVSSPKEGMEKSYETVKEIFDIMKVDYPLFKGSSTYLKNKISYEERLYKVINKPFSEFTGENPPAKETDFVDSAAARDLVNRAKNYSPENPLYVVCISAITDVTSAILMDKSIIENIVVVWLGGKARHFDNAKEFNLVQDYTAVRTVMNSGVPFVQIPCLGVSSHFKVSEPEIERWLIGTTPIADYLAKETISCMKDWAKSDFWTTSLYDVAAVAWLINDNQRFMNYRIENVRLPNFDGFYEEELTDKKMCYVYYLERDPLMKDLFDKLTSEN